MSVYLRIISVIFAAIFLMLVDTYDVSSQPFGISATQEKQENNSRILSSEFGRYVFGQISDSTRDLFMLDTKTGRLWRTAESGKIGLYLKSVPYRLESLEGEECSYFPEAVTGIGHRALEKSGE